MEKDKIVKMNNNFKDEIKVTHIKKSTSNIVNIPLRKKMEERMNQLMKEYIYLGEEYVIGIFVSEFENEYSESLDIEEYAKNLLEKTKKGIGSR